MPKVPEQADPMGGGGNPFRPTVSPTNLLMAAADMQDRGRLTHDSFKPTKPTGPIKLHAPSSGKGSKLR